MAKRKSNNILLILGISVGALLLLAIIAKSAGWIGKEKPTEVEIEKAKRAEIIEKVSASGKIQPEIEVKISPDVSGEITELFVKEGDSVVQGQLLLRIRPENYQLAVDRSNAAVKSSEASTGQMQAQVAQMDAQFTRTKLDFERQKKLHDQKVISDADFQTSEANFIVAKQNLEAAKQSVQAAKYNFKSSQASLKDAQTNLRKTEIFSPVNGIVSKLSVEKGERVVGTSQMAGTEMLRIANLNNMEVQVDVNENDITKVNLKDTVIIEVDAYSDKDIKFKGIVTEIANTANSTTSADAVTEFQVKIRMLQDSYKTLMTDKKSKAPFRPGMTASVEIITEKKSNILSVPLSSVTTRNADDLIINDKQKIKKIKDTPKGNSVDDENQIKAEKMKEIVFIFENGKAVAHEVKTGISDFDNIEIVNGLKEKDEIVIGPFAIVSKKLKNGDLIAKKMNNRDDIKK